MAAAAGHFTRQPVAVHRPGGVVHRKRWENKALPAYRKSVSTDLNVGGVDMRSAAPEESDDRHLLFGLALILIGIAFLLDRFGVLDVSPRYWPFILVFLGLVRLVFPRRSRRAGRSRRPGVLLIALGSWGLASEFHVLGLTYETSWPLLIVIWGLMLVWKFFEGPPAREPSSPLDVVRGARELAARVGAKHGEPER